MKTLFDWMLRIATAAILFQTLFFKFLGAEESIYIFSTLGMEPWGRYMVGISELICVILLLIPRTVAFGSLLSIGVIAGAIIAHITKLGIEVQGDGGLLFGLAVAVFLCSAVLLWIHRTDLLKYLPPGRA